MHSKLLLLVPLLLAGAECLATYSNVQQPNTSALANWKLNLPTSLGSLFRRADEDPDEYKNYWVFFVRIGHEKDRELDDIRSFIKSELGSDRKKTKERWSRAVKGGIMWFYLKCDKGIAERIVKQWEKSVCTPQCGCVLPRHLIFPKKEQSSVNVNAERNPISAIIQIKYFRPCEPKVLTTDEFESIPEPETKSGTANKKGSESKDPKLHKRSYLLKLKDQRPETCMVSKHPNAQNLQPDAPCTYETNSSQGRGVVVYVIDRGFDLRHTDFRDVNWAADEEHLFIDQDESWDSIRSIRITESNTGSSPYHGTLVLSKLLGAKNGVAKLVTPVIVKFTAETGRLASSWYVECIAEVIRRIEERTGNGSQGGPQGSGQYIILSTFSTPLQTDDEKRRLDEAFETLRSLNNVLFVVSAGNGNEIEGRERVPPERQYRRDPILKTMLPRAYGYDDANHNLIVVGGTDLNGRILYQTAPFVHVSAPAVDVELATGQFGLFRGTQYAKYRGTSLSAPAVAGVLATYISAYGDTATEAKDRLYRLAYPRLDTQEMSEDMKKRYPPVVYNSFGQDPDDNQEDCADGRRRLVRRASAINGTATSDHEDISCPTPTSAQMPPPKSTSNEGKQPVDKNQPKYNADFCKLCMEADEVNLRTRSIMRQY
ncbi:hypothetical protein TWF481_007547 [Arthrobotrys musiformis]|uniref:Peptidase S8/S53 domain-containing protein n=1 Tax=Arthrobotrys musiformis TaxID=47236 RepID=A0AAV9WDR5_9PEZI